MDTRSHLKIRILVQVQGEPEIQPTGILKYSEELKQGTNTEIGPKNYFEIASNDTLYMPIEPAMSPLFNRCLKMPLPVAIW